MSYLVFLLPIPSIPGWSVVQEQILIEISLEGFRPSMHESCCLIPDHLSWGEEYLPGLSRVGEKVEGPWLSW